MRILLVEDDIVISENISKFLRKNGMAIDVVATLDSAYIKSLDENYDLIILDRMLPDGDGVDLIEKIRNDGVISPILILTAKSLNTDVIEGLEHGADDYLSKPFDMHILLARVRALLRRKTKSIQDPLYRIGKLEIDTNKLEVKKAGRIIRLTPKEFSLLEYLARNLNHAVDREAILSNVWDENADQFSNTVDVHIRYLRKKVGLVSGVEIIKTIKGKGYMLCKI